MPLIDDLASYTLDFMDTCDGGELQHRLRMYQVFLKLYEHHRGLLDEILSLEHSGSKTLSQVPLPYLQGVIVEQEVSLTTNLLQGKTQTLVQPQNTWVIGRDPRRVSLPIQDARLSRCHAALKYVEHAGFYLIDLGSRNGSYVNGEPIRRPRLLCDGDRIRLGSLTLVFFLNQTVQSLPDLSPELEKLLGDWHLSTLKTPGLNATSGLDEVPTEAILGSVNPLEDTSMFMRVNPSD
ncbi:FHA domain-containing protein [Egbenema bharatensis]|uniref:FHA domain-containing protein n=1 Tax=Egbenema bharatensis TaxID=3463334 RepID=UPI003A877B99